MSERAPPNDFEAERAVVGIAILRREIPPELAGLSEGDFFSPPTIRVWGAMIELHKQGIPLDMLTVNAELARRGEIHALPDGEAFLVGCASVPTGENGAHYARLILETAALRRIITACSEAASRAYGRTRADVIGAALREQLAVIENRSADDQTIRVGDKLTHVIDAIEQRAHAPEQHFVRTGIAKFDRIFGGLRPEKLVVVAGPPGMGKSAWATTVAAYNVLRDIPSLIISLEMGWDELIERCLSAEARVPNQELSSGRVAGRDAFGPTSDWKAVFEAARRFGPAPFWINDAAAATCAQVIATIRRWYARVFGAVPPVDKPPHRAFVAVDYLGLITPDETDESETHALAIGRMTRALKGLARTLRIPLALLCQLNRNWAKRGSKPQLTDLRDSGAIEQDADTVIMPWRDPARDRDGQWTVDVNQAGPAEWIIPKNRGGATGSVGVMWIPEYTTFCNLAEER
jgi:replicative DNA helicase